MVINGIIIEKNARTRDNKISGVSYTRNSYRSIYNYSNREKIMNLLHQITTKNHRTGVSQVMTFFSRKEALDYTEELVKLGLKKSEIEYEQIIGKK